MNIADLVERHAPAPFLDEAIGVVSEHGSQFGTTDKRRASAVRVLQAHLSVKEHVARLLVELAVLWMKHRFDGSREPAADDGR